MGLTVGLLTVTGLCGIALRIAHDHGIICGIACWIARGIAHDHGIICGIACGIAHVNTFGVGCDWLRDC